MLANGKSRLPIIISETEIEELEQWMDAFDEKLNLFNILFFPEAENLQHFYMQQEPSAEEQNVHWYF
jgi:hypothetical protein